MGTIIYSCFYELAIIYVVIIKLLLEEVNTTIDIRDKLLISDGTINPKSILISSYENLIIFGSISLELLNIKSLGSLPIISKEIRV